MIVLTTVAVTATTAATATSIHSIRRLKMFPYFVALVRNLISAYMLAVLRWGLRFSEVACLCRTGRSDLFGCLVCFVRKGFRDVK